MSATDRRVRAAIQDATRAVSIHNSQPWHFVIERDADCEVQVWLDANRPPRLVDPDGRWALQSVGAAVANLQLGLAHRLRARVSIDELPAGGWSPPKALRWEGDLGLPPELRPFVHGPLAVLSWTGEDETDPTDEALFGAIEHRYTSRAPFLHDRVSARQWQDLTGSGWVGSVWTTPSTPEFTQAFLQVTALVEHELLSDPAYLVELDEWVGHRGRDGIPSGAVGVRDRARHFPGRDFSRTVSHQESRLPEGDFEELPQLAVIHSATDTAVDWLRAGEALQRVALRATAGGLRVGILGQAIEDLEAHAKVNDLFDTVGGGRRIVQQVLRLGFGDGTARPAATPRRRLHDALTVM